MVHVLSIKKGRRVGWKYLRFCERATLTCIMNDKPQLSEVSDMQEK